MRDERVLTVAETGRLAVVLAVVERRLSQKEAVRIGLSSRQVKRLAKRYRERGGGAGVRPSRQGSEQRAGRGGALGGVVGGTRALRGLRATLAPR